MTKTKTQAPAEAEIASRWGPSGRSPMPCGRRSSPSSWSSGPRSRPAGGPPTGGRALNGIIFRMRTGCQWEQLPRKFGPKSTVHDWFQRWCAGRGHANGSGPSWSRSATSWGPWIGSGRVPTRWLGKARFGGKKVGKNPTDRGKMGTKKSRAGRWRRRAAGGGDRRGQRAGAAAAARRRSRRSWSSGPSRRRRSRSTCAWTRATITPRAGRRRREAKYIAAHPTDRRGGKPRPSRKPGHKPRRWVVERTLAWLSKCRGILVRYDKKDDELPGADPTGLRPVLVSAAATGWAQSRRKPKSHMSIRAVLG